MTEFKIYLDDNSNICIDGNIDFTNVVNIRDQGLELMNMVSAIDLDFEKLQHVDSSSLSLLIAWARAAKKQHKQIRLFNIPSCLISLARVSGIDSILDI